jgi:hypothetical protein
MRLSAEKPLRILLLAKRAISSLNFARYEKFI